MGDLSQGREVCTIRSCPLRNRINHGGDEPNNYAASVRRSKMGGHGDLPQVRTAVAAASEFSAACPRGTTGLASIDTLGHKYATGIL